ncbi:tetratricopeptide repeat protein, partial [Streptomyces sp. NPDC042319]|uniref:tetratricopeptide repeat protein n=1 Tax=Streptomyces sp. NPDC042319 TaxID=3154332 RepID=UPI003409522A
MVVEPSGSGDGHTEVAPSRQDAVVTGRGTTGSMAITTSGARVPSYLQDPQGWPLVEAWGALAAGAHPARPDAAGDTVPPYVPRDIDTVLRARLAKAVEQGGLLLVVGESTAGKTRAAHQAVRQCEALGGCRVLAPDTGPDLVIAVEVVATTRVRCMVWLDDLEQYLGPGGLETEVLAELVRLQVPVVATMQLRHYDMFYPRNAVTRSNGPDGRQAAAAGARVLMQTEPLPLQRRWSSDELARAEACDDPRIIDAATRHGPYGVAEYLAAGPALLTEWRYAARPGGHPRGAALVAAAVDLIRTGLRPPYPTSLLTTLHQHYLPDSALLRPEPPNEALDWASRLRHGTTSLLLPTNDPDAWNVFDYLSDHTVTPIPTQVWDAALNHATDSDGRFTIGLHAYDAAPQIAEAAWRSIAQHVPAAAFNLGVLLAEAGRSAEAEQLYRRAADAGDTTAAFNLGVLLAEAGRSAEAEQLYRRAADAGHPGAANNLGNLLAQMGRGEEAEQLYRRALSAGHPGAANNLGVLLAEAGRGEEAEQLYRRAADAGDINAV